MDGQIKPPTTPDGFVVTRLTGVYNFDDTPLGRISFQWAGARGQKRCALFDTTHKKGKPDKEWAACEQQLPVPIEFFDREHRPHDVVVVTGGKPPCIVAHTASRAMLIVLASEIERCGGDPHKLLELIMSAVPRWSLRWA